MSLAGGVTAILDSLGIATPCPISASSWRGVPEAPLRPSPAAFVWPRSDWGGGPDIRGGVSAGILWWENATHRPRAMRRIGASLPSHYRLSSLCRRPPGCSISVRAGPSWGGRMLQGEPGAAMRVTPCVPHRHSTVQESLINSVLHFSLNDSCESGAALPARANRLILHPRAQAE
jgi:hypothetical protein